MLMLMLAIPQFLVDLLGTLATPVIVPALTSGIFWVMNTYITWVGKQHDLVKRVAVVVIGTGIGYLGSRFGLDVTTVEGFAASFVALGIFQLGHLKGEQT